ncbi:MAG: pilus assembly protein [Deltaproteobacteria bacterium]|nr:pilus assembly protein [Deltaproteobacteria bacterium]
MKLSKPFYTAALQLWQQTAGVSAVEMAIILPVFLLGLCGIIDFGNLYVESNLVNNATATAAQAAAYNATTQTALQASVRSNYNNDNLMVTTSYGDTPPPAQSATQPPTNFTVTVSSPVHLIIVGSIPGYFNFGDLPGTVTGTLTRVTEY